MKENPLPYSDEKAFRVAYLIAGYIRKTLTIAEHDELDAWVEESDENMLLFEELTDPEHIEANLAWMEQIQTEKALKKTAEKINFPEPVARHKRRASWAFIAAASLLFIAVSLFVFRNGKNSTSPTPVEIARTDAAPGTNKALLTLGNGSIITLDDKGAGLILDKTGTRIEKTAEGQLMYEQQEFTNEPEINMLSIPRGGQYAVTLADGTKVWLNSLSSLKYPEQFSDSVRVVELNGEAFFKVAKDRKHPFIVKLPGNEEVRVLGTEFNVLSYTDEEAKRITLVEGSVQVSTQKAILKISPGQQARIKTGLLSVEKDADMDEALGWKNGSFVFRDQDIYGIMRQAERWYDVNVIYKTTSSEHFNFSLSRNEPLSKLLHLMELTGKIHFKIENKTVYVLP